MVISCGVSYESDLVRAETVSLEVMEQLRREHPGAHGDTEPIFRYEAFGDSNITFYMVVRAKGRLAGFVIRSELIKQLHSRLAAEGITINYPMRKLHFPEGLMPQIASQPEPQLPGGAQVRGGCRQRSLTNGGARLATGWRLRQRELYARGRGRRV